MARRLQRRNRPDEWMEDSEDIDLFGEDRQSKLVQPVEPTLVRNIERIIDIAKFTELDDRFAEMAAPFSEFVMGKLHVTREEANLIAILMNFASSGGQDTSDISRAYDCSVMRVLGILQAVDGLRRRRFIRISSGMSDQKEYAVMQSVIDAIVANEEIEENKKGGLEADAFFDGLYCSLGELDETHQAYRVARELRPYINDNMHLEFCKAVQPLLNFMSCEEQVLLICMSTLFVVNDDDMVGVHNWKDFMSRTERMGLTRSLKRGETALQNRGVIEEVPGDGMRENYYYRITDKYKQILFKGMDVLDDTKRKKDSDLLDSSSITEKQLFYNSEDVSQIEQLRSLLQPEQFKGVVARLGEFGMRKGFCCLFYGSPGTGKTETVYQLARETGRDLFVIDVSKIKSCWVGESEKNITAAFAKYRKMVRHSDNAPILLFNEADAVLGIRQEGAQRAVDKMENSIQNIILQEMENLEGIMIATTNLTKNLDPAFDRRFIYKIEFHTPDLSAKTAIWKSMVKDIDDSEAAALAGSFDLSGGQIENVVRKRITQIVLNGTAPTLAEMQDMCKAELMNKHQTSRVGFV